MSHLLKVFFTKDLLDFEYSSCFTSQEFYICHVARFFEVFKISFRTLVSIVFLFFPDFLDQYLSEYDVRFR